MFASVSRAITPLILAAAVVVAGPSASAAQQQAPPQPIENLSDDELQSFATAYLEVMTITEEAQASLSGVQDPERAQAIQADAQQRMQDVLVEHEIEPERYRRIAFTINQDPALSEQFVGIIQEMQDEGGGR